MMALGHSIRSLDLPLSLFDDLVSAFGQDITTNRYLSWTDVLDYCRRSANPVGRLVLRIAGYRDETLDRSSDALCTALQLTNFWQDFGRDWRAGRLYVPFEVSLKARRARERPCGGAMDDELDASHGGLHRHDSASCSIEDGSCATASVGACASNFDSRGTAGCAFSIASTALAKRC